MGNVYNSVQQIIMESNKLIELSKDNQSITIQALSKTLKDDCLSLNDLYQNHSDNRNEIDKMKCNLESVALRLEFYLSINNKELKERKELRDEAKSIYEFTRGLTAELFKSNKIDDKDVINWTKLNRWAMHFYIRSLHILFEEEEEDKINKVTIKKIYEG